MNSGKTFIILLMLVSLCAPAAAQRDNSVNILSDQITFVLPEGFAEVGHKSFDFKFANKVLTRPPQCCLSERIYAFNDVSRSISIAISFFTTNEVGLAKNAVEAQWLPDIKKLIEAKTEQNVKGVKWQKRELITFNGRTWIHLSFKATENGVSNVYDMLLTDFQGYLMAFNLSAPALQYEKNKDALAKVKATLKVNPVLLGDPIIRK